VKDRLCYELFDTDQKNNTIPEVLKPKTKEISYIDEIDELFQR